MIISFHIDAVTINKKQEEKAYSRVSWGLMVKNITAN